MTYDLWDAQNPPPTLHFKGIQLSISLFLCIRITTLYNAIVEIRYHTNRSFYNRTVLPYLYQTDHHRFRLSYSFADFRLTSSFFWDEGSSEEVVDFPTV